MNLDENEIVVEFYVHVPRKCPMLLEDVSGDDTSVGEDVFEKWEVKGVFWNSNGLLLLLRVSYIEDSFVNL